MFSKNLFLELEQLYNQARQGLVGRWLCLYVLRGEGEGEDRLQTGSLPPPIASSELLEAPGADKSAPASRTRLSVQGGLWPLLNCSSTAQVAGTDSSALLFSCTPTLALQDTLRAGHLVPNQQ